MLGKLVNCLIIRLLFINHYYRKDHWWWDTVNTNDGGVVFDEEVRNFFNLFNLPHVPNFVDSNLEVVSLNPSTFWGRGGFKILQFITPFQKSKLVVDSKDDVCYFILLFI